MAGRILNSILDFISYWKLQFYIATCLYVMDPEERIVFWIVLLIVSCLLGYAIFTYLPGHIMMLMTVIQDIVRGKEHTTPAPPAL